MKEVSAVTHQLAVVREFVVLCDFYDLLYTSFKHAVSKCRLACLNVHVITVLLLVGWGCSGFACARRVRQ